MDKAPPKRIGFLLIPGFAMLSTSAAMEPLRAANLLSGRRLYDLVLLSPSGGAVASSLPVSIETARLDPGQAALDLLFVVAGGDPFTVTDPSLFAALRRLDRQGVTLGGISGGAAILAMAGLMDHRRFTLHWHHLEDLRRRCPQALAERRLFVIDRDRYSCAGGSAPLDMMHALIAADHGARFARQISDWFIQTDIRGADAPQQASVEARFGPLPPPVVQAVELMETHIADPLDLAQLSDLVEISSRQLQRQFGQALNQSVMQCYRDLRLAVARDLLQQARLSLGEIAQLTGFTTQSHFSVAYRRRYGETPQQSRGASGRELGRSRD